MKEHRVSFRYAKALLESARQEGVADTILNDFRNVRHTFEMSRELRLLAASPVFQLWRKKKILHEIFEQEKVSKMTMDFLILLIEKRRGELILSIIYEYELQYNIMNNRLPIQISSAVDMNDAEKEKVVKRISDLTKMTILPKFITDPSIKGGILVRIGDWVFDASIKNQLVNLHRILAEG
jgi:F-type H+-transporting ATPase subunit delta